jgi:hypothetical protein
MGEKLPWFSFYPEDWLSDEKLRACTLAARALWTDMLCLMHKNDRRGYLQLSGKPVTADQLARMTGCSTDDVSRLLAELISAGVPSVSEHGILYSRRMVRDEALRQVRSEAGQKGGRQTGRLLKQIAKQKSSKRSSKRQAPEPEPDLEKRDASASLFSADKPPQDFAQAKPQPEKSKPPRQRDELFDAVVAVTEADPKVNGPHIGRVCKALRSADPPYTPADVARLPAAIAAAGLDFRVTVPVVEKWIYLVRAAPRPSANGHASRKPSQMDFSGQTEFLRRHQERSNDTA